MENKKPGSSYKIGGKSHYQRNREKYIERQRLRVRLNVQYIRDIKKLSSCTDCGITDWRVLDFDHLPEFTKLYTIGGPRMTSCSRETIDKELAKCEIVCSNCHRIRTYERARVMFNG